MKNKLIIATLLTLNINASEYSLRSRVESLAISLAQDNYNLPIEMREEIIVKLMLSHLEYDEFRTKPLQLCLKDFNFIIRFLSNNTIYIKPFLLKVEPLRYTVRLISKLKDLNNSEINGILEDKEIEGRMAVLRVAGGITLA
ncbi:hypothetical protein A3F66_06675 [candidate division TM6 bacterium RIFCSPHIGHO2_12_FULL_32_22]|nr:MAG: hypothetical protein A3F66_06675 [candidate division TM6 bacterium RIFCSPHIGHO2_12_FULL_32_22]